jgi:hypothetical protein
MSQVDALLARLQLRPDASEQDVRRAYARELKKIDQETQPETFQELRETYEQLTWWLRSRAAAASAPAAEAPTQESPQPAPDFAATEPMASDPATATASAPAEPPPMPPAMQAGQAVLDLVVQRLKARSFKDRADVQALLHRCLEDERLTSVDARQYFEWGIASILASGWQPGHELVFSPAVQVFGWGEDRSRLLWLGRPGEIVDQAIAEIAVFDTQDDADRALQRAVIQALRLAQRPGAGDLLTWLPVAESVLVAFPAWLHVNSNPRQVETWHGWNAEIPGWRRRIAKRPRLRLKRIEPAKREGANWHWAWILAVFVGIPMIKALTHESRTRPVTVPVSFAVPATPVAPPSLPPRPPLTPEQQKIRTWLENVNKQSLADAARSGTPYPEAHDRLTILAKGKHAPERCASVDALLREHEEAHARGDFGAAVDTLVVDCANSREGGLDPGLVQASAQRIIRKSQVDIEKLSRKQVAIELPPAAIPRGVPAARLQQPAPVPASTFDLAPDGMAPVTTDRNGLGLKPTGR